MGSIDDGYICSSKRMRSAYKRRPDTFKRKIIYYHLDRDRVSLFVEEQRWLDMISDQELSKKYYNAKRAANLTPILNKVNHWDDPEKRQKHIEGMKKSFTPERRQAQSEMMLQRWQDPEFRASQMPRLSKKPPMTDEGKQRVIAAHKGSKRSEESRKKMSEAAKARCSTPEYRENFRQRFHDDPIMKKKREDAARANHPHRKN